MKNYELTFMFSLSVREYFLDPLWLKRNNLLLGCSSRHNGTSCVKLIKCYSYFYNDEKYRYAMKLLTYLSILTATYLKFKLKADMK